jgi:putative ABC transport system substrate-binding protein
MEKVGAGSLRRDFLRAVWTCSAGLLGLFPAHSMAQTAAAREIPRVVFFNIAYNRDTEWEAQLRARIIARFASHGFADGRNVAVEIEDVDQGDVERRASEIGASRPRIICTIHVRLFQRLAPGVPIVFFQIYDPVKAGFVASLREPGGNVTGVSMGGRDVLGKRFEALKEIRPRATRIAILTATPEMLSEYGAMAKPLGLELVHVKQGGEDPGALAEAVRRTGADAFISLGVFQGGEAWAQLQRRSGVPGLFLDERVVARGGLLSVGPSIGEQMDKTVDIAARILRGEKPGSIAVDQVLPRLTINVTTARAMGIAIPNAALLRADRVIE